jgi:hypothetical protein
MGTWRHPFGPSASVLPGWVHDPGPGGGERPLPPTTPLWTPLASSWHLRYKFLKRVETCWNQMQKWVKYGQLQRLHFQCSLPNPLPIQTVLYQFPTYVHRYHRCFTWFHMYPGFSMFFSQTMLPRTRTWRSPAWVAPPPWNSRCGHSTGAPRWQPGVATRWIPNLKDPRIDHG